MDSEILVFKSLELQGCKHFPQVYPQTVDNFKNKVGIVCNFKNLTAGAVDVNNPVKTQVAILQIVSPLACESLVLDLKI